MKKLVLLVLFIALFSSAYAQTFYWLRGTDVSTKIEGKENFFMSATPPNSSSSKTILSIETKKGTGEISRWYSGAFSSDYLLSGAVFFLSNKLSSATGKNMARISIYEFSEETNESYLLAASDWVETKRAVEIKAEMHVFTVREKNRLKLVLEYREEAEKGKISMVVDEGIAFKETILETSTGAQARVFGADGTALLALDLCQVGQIACTLDSDCDDKTGLTVDSCKEQGTCRAFCVHEECSAECASNEQCSDKDYLTNDECVNAGSCSAFCENTTCSPECSSNEQCSDNDLSTTDECVFPFTCISFCANKECTAKDCGSGETNVCGNGICEAGEKCPPDCPFGNALGIIEPKAGQYFLLGDAIVFSVKPESALGARNIFAEGVFGKVELLDDGNAPDENKSDGVFSAKTKPAEQSGLQKAVFSVYGETGESKITGYYVVAPVLELSLSASKDNYYLGEVMLINGTLNRHGKPLSGKEANVALFVDDKKVFEKKAIVNEFGVFELEYRTSLIDKPGNIKITAGFSDEYANSGSASANAVLSAPKTTERDGQDRSQNNDQNETQAGPKDFIVNQNMVVFAVLAAGFLVLLFVKKSFSEKKALKKELLEKEKMLVQELKKTQENYFKIGFMSRREYDKKILGLELELSKTKKQLKGIK